MCISQTLFAYHTSAKIQKVKLNRVSNWIFLLECKPTDLFLEPIGDMNATYTQTQLVENILFVPNFSHTHKNAVLRIFIHPFLERIW